MLKKNQPPGGRLPRKVRNGGSTEEEVTIDNSAFPSTEEVGKLLNVPGKRVRELKQMAAALKAAGSKTAV